jgi:Domain of unknown function (DUF3943)
VLDAVVRPAECYKSAVTPATLVAVISVAAAGAVADSDAEPAAIRTREESRAVEAPPQARAPNIVVPALHGLALMTVMRVTESVLWPDPFAEPRHFGAHYEEAFTRPPKLDRSQPFMRWDGDPLFVNVVGHGLFGSELYLRARQCRLGWGGALAFAAATSAVWEYAFEGNGVRPSTQDLVYTPLMGLALGEARYFLHRAAGHIRSPARVVVRAVLDPFGELERAAGTDC